MTDLERAKIITELIEHPENWEDLPRYRGIQTATEIQQEKEKYHRPHLFRMQAQLEDIAKLKEEEYFVVIPFKSEKDNRRYYMIELVGPMESVDVFWKWRKD